MRWAVELTDPLAASLRATIELRGEPRSFGLSLLQGYVVEPLLAVLAPERGHVLLPGAAIDTKRGTILMIGRSRSGKSSLSARAAASGLPVLGDDHVLLRRDGSCLPFPRRLRLYPDLPETAPGAYRSLPAPSRATLGALGLVRAVTRGAVAPPLRLRIEILGAAARGVFPVESVVVIERAAVERLSRRTLEPEAAVEIAAEVIREQRAALDRFRDRSWSERLERVRELETQLLSSAFAGGRPAVHLLVPAGWPAGRAVSELAGALELEP